LPDIKAAMDVAVKHREARLGKNSDTQINIDNSVNNNLPMVFIPAKMDEELGIKVVNESDTD